MKSFYVRARVLNTLCPGLFRMIRGRQKKHRHNLARLSIELHRRPKRPPRTFCLLRVDRLTGLAESLAGKELGQKSTTFDLQIRQLSRFARPVRTQSVSPRA